MIFFKILKFAVLFVLLFSGFNCDAQNWIPGFTYRKKITIVKDKVALNDVNITSFTNFPVLVQLEHPDLKYVEDAFENKLTSAQGLDISFSSSTSANVPLKFQLENYNPATGKLVCWVILPVLNTKGTTVETSIYLYYGSSTVFHDPAVETMWQGSYHTLQHFNDGAEGKIATGRAFNGISDQKLVNSHSNTAFTLTAWIKLDKVGQEQIIMTNDSVGIGGYQLKVNSSNKLVFLLKHFSNSFTFTGKTILQVNEWHYVSISYAINTIEFLMDGVTEASLGGSLTLPQSSGKVFIGASNIADRYFNGIIDELRIGKIKQHRGWFTTEYTNQSDPAGFISVGTNEVNLNLVLNFTFLGGSSNWNLTANWEPQKLPGNNKNIKIKAGVTANILTNMVFNKLLLEPGAKINLNRDAQVLGSIELAAASTITSTLKVLLQLEGNVVNNGTIDLTVPGSKILFAGNTTNTGYSGAGTTTVDRLEVNKQAAGSILTLLAPLKVKTSLNIVGGELNANGNLVLLSNNGLTAALYPVLNNASITGNVQVQSFIAGSFPSPATGRGWRLLSSPVLHTGLPGSYKYQVQAIKNSIFVTGKAGLANGFDASPNNGATIYTHDQSLSGALAEKYIPIPDMQMQIPVGKGFFVYSRGSRVLPNAYQNQIQTPPFTNAEPYLITYNGRLFTGDLMVEVFNNDKGADGDGFNLLGNPYAAPIKWGSLLKINVGPFIWLYDPLNNNYIVSDDPEKLILPGEGFFIKVNQGSTSGFIGFNENSKVIL